LEKGKSVVSELIHETGNNSIRFHYADLSIMKSVQNLVVEIKRTYETIDVLLNNAGAYFSKLKMTDEGLEKTFALNHLSYFYLTTHLLEIVKHGIPGRIINVASTAHKNTELDFEDIQGINDYKGWPAYGRSKLMNIMFTYECYHRFSYSGVTFNCLHPGFVDSSFGNNNLGFAKNSIKIAKMLFAIDIVKGARTSVYLSSSDDVAGISGKYFDKCKVVQSSKASYIKEDQKKLWEATEELINSLQIN
jgi:NAD(P)-dependent dehydrogenase (short-subunit alcohol dehydrogenase family)